MLKDIGKARFSLLFSSEATHAYRAFSLADDAVHRTGGLC